MGRDPKEIAHSTSIGAPFGPQFEPDDYLKIGFTDFLGMSTAPNWNLANSATGLARRKDGRLNPQETTSSAAKAAGVLEQARRDRAEDKSSYVRHVSHSALLHGGNGSDIEELGEEPKADQQNRGNVW